MMIICASARWKLPTKASACADKIWLFLIIFFARKFSSFRYLHDLFANWNVAQTSRYALPFPSTAPFNDDTALGSDNS